MWRIWEVATLSELTKCECHTDMVQGRQVKLWLLFGWTVWYTCSPWIHQDMEVV